MIDLVMPAKGLPNTTNAAICSLHEYLTPGSYKLWLITEFDDRELQPYYDDWRSVGVQIIEGPRPGSFSEAIHRGATHVTSQVFGVINNDIRAIDDFLTPMLRHFDDPNVAVVGCKLLYARNHRTLSAGSIQHAGIKVALSKDTQHIVTEHHGLGDAGTLYNECRRAWAVTFALALLRKSDFDTMLPSADVALSGLDSAFGWGGHEDLDYCFRMSKAGKKVIYCGEAVALHHESASRDKIANGDLLVAKASAEFNRRWKKWVTDKLIV